MLLNQCNFVIYSLNSTNEYPDLSPEDYQKHDLPNG